MLSIRRRNSISDLAGHGSSGVLDGILEKHLRPEFQLAIDGVWNINVFASDDVNLVDFATKRSQEVLVVWCESHGGQNTGNSNRLLVIPLHWIGQPALITCFEVSDYQAGFVFKPCSINQPFAVTGKHRREGRSIAGGEFGGAGIGPVINANLVLRKLRIVVP